MANEKPNHVPRQPVTKEKYSMKRMTGRERERSCGCRLLLTENPRDGDRVLAITVLVMLRLVTHGSR